VRGAPGQRVKILNHIPLNLSTHFWVSFCQDFQVLKKAQSQPRDRESGLFPSGKIKISTIECHKALIVKLRIHLRMKTFY